MTNLPALRRVEEVQLAARGDPRRRAALWAWWFTLLPLLYLFAEGLYRRWAFRQLQQRPALPAPDPVTGTRAYAVAVLEGLQAAGLAPPELGPEAVEVHERAGGALRVLLRGAGEELAETFTEAVFELLGPVQNHKYLVERRESAADPAALTWALASGEPLATRRVAVHPVPRVLGKNRKRAEAFRDAWAKRVSPGELFYTRKGEGQELARQWFRKRTHDLRRVKKRYFS